MRYRWLIVGMGCLVGISFQPAKTVAAADRPNILVIVGDDMGYADLGVQGCKDIPTPHLDALANSGVRCTSGYVSCPYCSPTRAGLMTGRYQTHFGHEFNPGGARAVAERRAGAVDQQAKRNASDEAVDGDDHVGLPLSETTMAQRLKDAGYATGWVGKWHLGAAEKFHPQNRGFEETFGFLGGSHGYFPSARPPMLSGGKRVEEKEYLTDAFGREAVEFIDRHAGGPFFLYLAFNAVHTPMDATDDRLQKFKSIADEKRRTYAAMMSAMDDNVEKVLAKLDELKIADNTLVFFISDNGGPMMNGTSLNGSNNEPLRGSKRTTLEGGIRVPYFVRWSGRIPAGKVFDKPVIQLDILPTALAAAGVKVPSDTKLDGVDLLPHFSGTKKAGPHDTLYWQFGLQMAIRRGDWKLVRYDPVADGAVGRVTEAKLYNLRDDIGETRDLIQAQPEKAKELQAAWDKWNELNVPALWGGRGDGKRAPAQRPKAGRRAKQAAG